MCFEENISVRYIFLGKGYYLVNKVGIRMRYDMFKYVYLVLDFY